MTSRAPLRWFRVYADIIDDDKLGLLAFQDRWHFVAILALKASGLLDDECDPSLKYRRVAYKLGIAGNELDELRKRLADVGLIDRETMQPCRWADRQFENDTSRERQRRYRERKSMKGKGNANA